MYFRKFGEVVQGLLLGIMLAIGIITMIAGGMGDRIFQYQGF